MSKTIQLTKGKVAIVDDADYEWLSQWKWCTVWDGKRWYAARRVWKQTKAIYMHRAILNAPNGTNVDHKDGDGLNNTRENIRVCSHSQNLMNRGKTANNKSGFKGVSPYKRYGKYRASIKSQTIGYFNTAEEAAHAYDEAAKKYFGEFANLNFPESGRL